MRSSAEQQWNDEESKHCQHGNDQHHSQNRNPKIYFPIDSALKCIMVKNLPQFEGKEKERGVIADRRNVVIVGPSEGSWIVLRDQMGKGVVLRLRWKIERGQGWIHSKMIADSLLFLGE